MRRNIRRRRRVDQAIARSRKVHGKANPSNRRLARALADAGMSAFLREPEWQCAKRGVVVLRAPANFPSTQLGARCGNRRAKGLSLKARTYECQFCGWVGDRDLNAAINLAELAAAYPASTKAFGADKNAAPGEAAGAGKRVSGKGKPQPCRSRRGRCDCM